MAEVRLEQVTKRFGEHEAVGALDLTIADGEFVVLLGPTGAGKTTTLRLVAGLERLDGGRLLIDGTDVSALEPAARDVAFVFQQYSLYPHYSVFDNLAFPLRSPLRRTDPARIRQRVEEIARKLRIEAKLGNRATQLSGGEMQRVALGRALVREPTIFLMDEPLSSLDAKLREDLRIELKRIQRELGATILYVTHDQIEAMTLADRIGVLEHGRLLQIAPPREVYTTPANVEVARRLGSPPINLIAVGALPAPTGPAGSATVGIRPEDVRIGDGGLAARVDQVEPLGADAVVVLQVDGHELHALAPGYTPLRPGMDAQVALPPEALLYFDRDGRRLAA
jgi:multiple sugar transport system ATP-binding protein